MAPQNLSQWLLLMLGVTNLSLSMNLCVPESRTKVLDTYICLGVQETHKPQIHLHGETELKVVGPLKSS